MRILIFPSYEYPSDYRADSSYILTRALAKFLGENGHFVHWFVPASYASEEPPIPGVETIPYPMKVVRNEHEILFYRELDRWNPVWGERPVDVAITNNAGIASRLAEFFEAFSSDTQVPCFIWDFSTKYLGSDEVLSEDTSLMLHMTGYARCTSFEFSKFQIKAVKDTARAILAPAKLRHIEKNLRLVPIAFSPSEIDEATAGVKKEEVPTFFFSGRFTNTKGGEKAIEISDYLFRSGHQCKIVVSTPRGGSRLAQALKGRKGAVEVHAGLSQQDMWKQMARCHYAVFVQSLKMFPSSPMEWLYSGLLVAFRDYGYERDILPPGYPFLWKSDEEGYAIIRHFLEKGPELRRQLQSVPKWISANYSRDAGLRRIHDVLVSEVSERRSSPRLEELIRKCADDGLHSCSFTELREEVRKRAFDKNLIFASRSNRQAFSTMALYNTAMHVYEDDFSSENPRLMLKEADNVVEARA